MISVKRTRYLGDYKLEVEFNTGDIKVVDLESHLEGEIFEPVKKIEYFKTVKVNPEFETIYWDNGADIAPEFLFEIGENREDRI